MIAAAGPNFFSNGTCIYPRKPVSSQIPATKELTMTADQPSHTGKVFNILYCDLKAVSGKGMSRKVTTNPDSKTITKSKAANKPHFKTCWDKFTDLKQILLVSCVCFGYQLPLKYLRYNHKIRIISSNDQGSRTKVKSNVHAVMPIKQTKQPIKTALTIIEILRKVRKELVVLNDIM